MSDLMSVAQIATELGISPATFRTYVMRGKAPSADGHFDARTPYWNRSTIEEWQSGRKPRH